MEGKERNQDENHETCIVYQSSYKYDEQKKIKTEPNDFNVDNDNVHIECDEYSNIEKKYGCFESMSYTESNVASSFDSPESLCEVSLDEKCYRCPHCLYETNIKKYLKIHLASQAHLFIRRNETLHNRILDRQNQEYDSYLTKKFTECDLKAEPMDDRMETCKIESDSCCEVSMDAAYKTDIKKCLKMHLASQTHLFSAPSNETASNVIFEIEHDSIATKKFTYDYPERSENISPSNFLCKICGFEATSKRAFDEHTENDHQPQLKYEIKCNTRIPKKRPWSVYDSEETVQEGNYRLKYSRTEKVDCEVCGYQGKDGIDLKVHKLKHRDVSQLLMHKCIYCDVNGSRNCQIRKNRSGPKNTRHGGVIVSTNFS